MTLKEIILEGGKLKVIREGTIYVPLGNVRGINPVHSCPFGRTDLKVTLVKYVSSEEIPEGEKLNSEFIFYDELPEEIEGRNFAFTETYPTKDKSQMPLEQYLAVWKDLTLLYTFEFPRK